LKTISNDILMGINLEFRLLICSILLQIYSFKRAKNLAFHYLQSLRTFLKLTYYFYSYQQSCYSY